MEKHDKLMEVTGRGDLPPLRGTGKRIAEAEKVRANILPFMRMAMDGQRVTDGGDRWNDRDIFALLPEKELRKISERCKELEPKERREFLILAMDEILDSKRMRLAYKSILTVDSAEWWIANKDARASELLVAQYISPVIEALAESNGQPPSMCGRQERVAEAEEIRRHILPQVDIFEAKEKLEERILKAKKEIQHCEMLQDACETIRTIDSAEWWIANKNMRTTNLIANQYYILEAEDDIRNGRPIRGGVEKIMAENRRLLTNRHPGTTPQIPDGTNEVKASCYKSVDRMEWQRS